MKSLKHFWVLIFITLFGSQVSFAQLWTQAYTSPTATGNCAGLTAGLTSEFSVTPVISQQKFPSILPIREVAFCMYMDPGKTSGYADIYAVEKGAIAGSPRTTAARVLYYNGADSTLKVIGRVLRTTNQWSEFGANGICVNPKTFAQDHLLYTFTSVGLTSNQPDATHGFDISTYKLNPTTHMMDSTSEKVLLHIPAGTVNRTHLGGKMIFDDFGNLYIGVGDNATLATGPPNTADLRGGIIRIHPDTTAPRGYTIPPGNFGEYWANQWESQGLTARAAAYRDTSIVKSEIYVKGIRQPYGADLDPHRLGWIAWGACGPDAQRREMATITTHPAFAGWPFWSGGLKQTTIPSASGYTAETGDVAIQTQYTAFSYSSMSLTMPINNWATNKGYDTLPPTMGNLYIENTGCSVATTILRYDGRINNPGMMPPHLNNTFLHHNCGTNNYYMSKFDTTTGAGIAATTGTLYGTSTLVFPSANYTRSTTQPALGWAMDMHHGPDGYIYSMNYGECCCAGDRDVHPMEGVVRIRYTGTCQDPGLVPTSIGGPKALYRGDVNWLRMGGKSFSVYASGSHAVRIMDMQGRTVYSLQGYGQKDYDLPSNLSGNTVYYLQVKTNQGTAVRGFLHQ